MNGKDISKTKQKLDKITSGLGALLEHKHKINQIESDKDRKG